MRHRFARQPTTDNSVKVDSHKMDSENQVMRNVIQATAVKVGTPTNLQQQRDQRSRILLQGVVSLHPS